jgi:hypothetical protein
LSEYEQSPLKDLDASMYALATLNLLLVHPSSQSTLTAGQPVALEPAVTASTDISLSRGIDNSAYKTATINLSPIHPSDDSRSQVATMPVQQCDSRKLCIKFSYRSAPEPPTVGHQLSA